MSIKLEMSSWFLVLNFLHWTKLVDYRISEYVTISTWGNYHILIQHRRKKFVRCA